MSKHESELPLVGARPGLGFSLQVDLGAGRVATLQTFLPNDCSLVELNEMLDKMTSAGDRQRAHYQIEGFERELKQYEKEQEQGRLDLEKIEADFQQAQLDRMRQIEQHGSSIASFEEARAAANEDSGRRNPQRLTAQQAANVKTIEKRMGELKAAIEVAKEEHAKTLIEAKKVIERRAALIEKTKREIEHCRAIVARGLEPDHSE